MAALNRLIAPRSIALIGASADAEKLTGRPLHYLQRHGFSGAIYPVNPRADSIAGVRCYRDIASLPEPPDAAFVLLGGERVIDAVRQLSAIGTGAAIVLASGFGESGEEGRRQEEEIKRAAGTMRVLGPNSIGLINVSDGVALTASNALVDGRTAARIDRARLAERRNTRRAAFSRVCARDRLFQIDRHRQRMRHRRRGLRRRIWRTILPPT